jgi:hypothetical protein
MPEVKGTEPSDKDASQQSFQITPLAVTLPKGGAIKGIAEKFGINPFTGTWSLRISMDKRLGQVCTTALPLLRSGSATFRLVLGEASPFLRSLAKLIKPPKYAASAERPRPRREYA